MNTSCEFIMNDCIITTKQSTTKPYASFLGYTVERHDRQSHGQSQQVMRLAASYGYMGNTGQGAYPKNTVYPKKYAHGFVVLCFVVVMQSFIMNSHEVFIFIPCSVLILASDWLTTVKYGAVSHVWRHHREILRQRNVIDDVTMAIPTAVRFPYRYGTT